MKSRTVAQSVIETLVDRGVDTVFGMPGSHVNDLYPFLAARSIRHITIKHENNGAVMADVYGRLTGKPGVLITTAGPGGTHALSGIAGAYNAASPLIHLCGSPERGGKKEGFHGSSSEDFLQKIFEPVTRWSYRLKKAEDLPRALAKAFEISMGRRPGPVHLEIPLDLLAAKQVGNGVRPINRSKDRTKKNLPVLSSMAKAIEKASYPVIYAGKGVLAEAGQEALRLFAEQTGMPVVTAANAPGIFPEDHPLSAGFVAEFMTHPFGVPFAIETLGKADVILTVGFGADHEETEIVYRLGKKKILSIGFDASDRIDPKSKLGVVQDCRSALETLLTLMRKDSRPWDRDISDQMEAYKKRMDEGVERFRSSKPLYFGIALKELSSFLGPDSICTTDVGNTWVLTRLLLPIYSKATLVTPGTYQAMGFALPGAIGAKLAKPEKRVVGITGDGCFWVSCSEFLTAVEQKLPLVLVVSNDGHYGVIHYLHRKKYGQAYCSEIGRADLVKFAESCGGVGFRVEEASELGPAFKEAFSANVPALVEVATGCDFPYSPLDKE